MIVLLWGCGMCTHLSLQQYHRHATLLITCYVWSYLFLSSAGASIPPLFVKAALYMFKNKIQESLGVDPYTVSPLQWLQ